MGSLGSFPYDGSVSRVRVRGAHKRINPGALRTKRANPRIAIQNVSPRSGRQRKAWGVSPRITIGIIPPAREAGDGLKGDSHVRLLHDLLYYIVLSPKIVVRSFRLITRCGFMITIGGTIRSLGGTCLELNGTEAHI